MDRLDVVTSSVTFTNTDAALTALRRRAAEAAWPTVAASARTLREALLAFTLDLREDPGGPCRLLHTGGPYSHSLVECALEAIAPYVTNGSQLVCRCDRREVWRWRFNREGLAFERGSLTFLEGDPAAHVALAIRRPVVPAQLDRLAATIASLVGDYGLHEFSLEVELHGATPHRRRVSGTTLEPADA